MNFTINALTAPDNAPTAASTLDNLPVCSRVNIDVANAGILLQLKVVDDPSQLFTQGRWQQAVQQIPTSRTYFRSIVGVRFWASIPLASLPAGQFQAVVTVEAVE